MSRCITRDYMTRSKGPVNVDDVFQSFNPKEYLHQPPTKITATRKRPMPVVPLVKSAIVTTGSDSKDVGVWMDGKQIGIIPRSFADRCKVAKDIKTINLHLRGQLKYSVAYSFIMGHLVILPDEPEEEIQLAYNRIMADLMYEE